MAHTHKNHLAGIMGLLALLIGLLLVPVSRADSATCGVFYTVQRGDTLSRIARAMGVTASQLQTWNNLANPNRIYVGQSLCVKMVTTGSQTYTVQRGDTLYSIARRHGVSMAVLAQVNNITNYNRIYAGQVLRIPDVTIQ